MKKEQSRKQNLTAIPPPDTATQIPLVSFNLSYTPTAPAFCHYNTRRQYLAQSSVLSLSAFSSQLLLSPPSVSLSSPSVCNWVICFVSSFFIHHLQTSVCSGSLQGSDAECHRHFGLACVSLHTRVCVCSRKRQCLSILSLHEESRPVRCGAQ